MRPVSTPPAVTPTTIPGMPTTQWGTQEQIGNVRNRFYAQTGRHATDEELQRVLSASGKDYDNTSWDVYDAEINRFLSPTTGPNDGRDAVTRPIGGLGPRDPNDPNSPTVVTPFPGPGRGPWNPRPTAPTLARPTVPGATISPYGGEEGDLRGGMITPGASARLSAATGRTDAAAGRVASNDVPVAVGRHADSFSTRLAPTDVGFTGVNTDVAARDVNTNVGFRGVNTNVDAGDEINPADTEALARFRQLQSGAADAVGTGPSRAQIAQQRLEAFDTAAQPGIRDGIQAVGRRAASLGRIGIGATSVEALQPYTDYLTRRSAMETELAADTAEGEITDRRANLSQMSDVVGQEESIGAGRRGELRGERGFRAGIETDNVNRAVGERDTELGVSERNVDRNLADRDYRTGLSERNVGRQTTERDTALGLTERNTGRAFDARRAALEAAMGVTGMDSDARRADLGALTGVESEFAGREAGYRDELRGERGFQQGMSQTDIENEVRRRGVENDEYQTDVDAQIRQLALSMGVDPSMAYLEAARRGRV